MIPPIMSFSRLTNRGRGISLSWIAVFLGVVLTVPLTMGQEAVEYQVPAKDVVVLVDVSGSMAIPGSGGKPINEVGEAREIIIGIVEGRGFPKMRGWQPVGASGDPIIKQGFASYFSRDLKAPLPPLIRVGNSVGVKLAGNFNTVIKNTLQKGKDSKWDDPPYRVMPRDKQIGKLEDFKSVLGEGNSWPDKFQDQSTCYTFALALAALGMGDGVGGYYIFTVSDEEDDSSYDPISAEGRKDQLKWKQLYEINDWSVPQIEAAIKKGMAALAGTQQGRWSSIKSDQLIARFEKSRLDGRKIRINWYYGGEKPKVIPKPENPVPPEPPPEPPDLQFRLLGTAAGVGEPKVFNYGNAMLVYQIDNLIGKPPSVKATIESKEVSVVTTTQRRPGGGTVTTFALGDLFTAASNDKLKYGNEYTLKLSADGVPAKEFKFKVDPPSLRWLYWLGAVSAAVALGIFIYSWRTLRGADQVG